MRFAFRGSKKPPCAVVINQPRLAPLRACREPFLKLPCAVPSQNGHQRSRYRQYGDRGLGLHRVQSELAVNAVKCLSDRQSCVIEINICPGKP